MSEPSVPTGISAEDWAATPVTVRQLVVMLLGQMAELNERVNQTSRNSSKPPSSDGPAVASRPRRSRSERKKGGQKGHAGHGRKLKPEAEVKRVVELRPMRCTDCGTLLLGEDPSPVRHQVTELPRVEAEVVEYRQHTLTCLDCGKPTTVEWPADMPVGQFGPRLQATIGYLTGRMGMSQRDVAEMMDVVFHTDISLGSITAQEKRVSAAVAAPVQEARSYVQQQAVNNVDETSWREGTQRYWLWVNTTVWVTRTIAKSAKGEYS